MAHGEPSACDGEGENATSNQELDLKMTAIGKAPLCQQLKGRSEVLQLKTEVLMPVTTQEATDEAAPRVAAQFAAAPKGFGVRRCVRSSTALPPAVHAASGAQMEPIGNASSLEL